MTKFGKYSAFAVSLVLTFRRSRHSRQQGPAVTGDQASGYHMRVVSRSTEAVDYRHKGSTKVNLQGTDISPEVKRRGESRRHSRRREDRSQRRTFASREQFWTGISDLRPLGNHSAGRAAQPR